MRIALHESRYELNVAKQCLADLKHIKEYEAFKRLWNEFLGALEKCWNKAERECQILPQNTWRPFQGRYINLRKDALLKYLKEARDSDNHLVQKLINQTPHELIIKNKEGEELKEVIINLQRQSDGSVVGVSETIDIESIASKIELLPFYNRGELFNPPSDHLGVALLDGTNPLVVGDLGVKFYEDFLLKIESKFFK